MSRVISRLVLASQSKARRSLLEATGLEFECRRADIDESTITGQTPHETARIRAEGKALSAVCSHGELVIGADQTLALGNRLFEKVSTEEEAFQVLQELQGKTHVLFSALSLVYGTKAGEERFTPRTWVVPVEMTMRKLSAPLIESYLQSGEWHGCVGCYQFENKGSWLFEKVTGDQAAIMGLPVLSLLSNLRDLGIDFLEQSKAPWALRTQP